MHLVRVAANNSNELDGSNLHMPIFSEKIYV